MKASAALLLYGWVCVAGTEPRKSAKEYAAHAVVAQGDVGAEFLGRAYDGGGVSFYAQNYLVIEVALFPGGGPALRMAPGDFRLRLNGATREWGAVTAGTVAAALRNPAMDGVPGGVVASGGVGPGVVVLGGPRSVERFPGDPQARVPSRPGTGPGVGPGVGGEQRPSDVEQGAEAAVRLGLEPVAVGAGGASGLIYFYWKGKVKDLKRIELVYEGPAGKTALRLR